MHPRRKARAILQDREGHARPLAAIAYSVNCCRPSDKARPIPGGPVFEQLLQVENVSPRPCRVVLEVLRSDALACPEA